MREDGHLVQDDGGILDEAAVGLGGIPRQADDVEPEALEHPAVGGVLADGAVEVDRVARPERQLAAGEGGRDLARQGDVRHP